MVVDPVHAHQVIRTEHGGHFTLRPPKWSFVSRTAEHKATPPEGVQAARQSSSALMSTGGPKWMVSRAGTASCS